MHSSKDNWKQTFRMPSSLQKTRQKCLPTSTQWFSSTFFAISSLALQSFQNERLLGFTSEIIAMEQNSVIRTTFSNCNKNHTCKLQYKPSSRWTWNKRSHNPLSQCSPFYFFICCLNESFKGLHAESWGLSPQSPSG